MELLDDVICALRRMHQPVIAAINGAAIGGGFCLAGRRPTSAIAAEGGVLPRRRHQQRPRRRASSGSAICSRAPSAHRRAFEIMLSGRDVDAAEAERIGLVSRAVPGDQLLDAVLRAGRAHHRVQPRRRSRARSACCGRASTPAACTRTWTTRPMPSCTCDSRPRTSRRRSGPGAKRGPVFRD